MARVTLTAIAAAAAILVLAGSALSHSSATPTLVGTVGPSFHITLTKGGKLVKTLPHGRYKFVIHDRASIHAFSLDGPHGFAHDFHQDPVYRDQDRDDHLEGGKVQVLLPEP